MFLSEWREFPSAPCLTGKKNLMTARVSMLLKSRASLTCFRARFLPGRAKDLSAPRYMSLGSQTVGSKQESTDRTVRKTNANDEHSPSICEQDNRMKTVTGLFR